MLVGYFNFSNIVTIIFAINVIISLTIIFLERKDPSATLAWIMVLFLVPVLGIILYFLFSQNIARKKIFKLTKFEEDIMETALEEQLLQLENDTFNYSNNEEKKHKDLIRLNMLNDNAYLTQNNSIEIITDGNKMYDRLIEDIDRAEKAINIEFFIVKKDQAGLGLITALARAASKGIEVRFLVDAMGGRQISHRDLRVITEAGGRVAFFFPPRIKHLNVKFNYRNHRKIVVIDNKIGYLGGFNIGNEYLGKKKKFGHWRDTHMRVTGGCVQDMNARFILDWRTSSDENLVVSEVYIEEGVKAGRTPIQIVSSGPDSTEFAIKRGYLKLISSAKRNIYIQTPYFVPDVSIFEALYTAAKSGVDVRIMIPSMPDHMFVYWATYSYVGELIEAGARVYIYDNGFMHAKTISVDGEVSSVGSANFDIRSFQLNFEGNAFIYDAAETYKLESIFEHDMTKSHELTLELYKQRSIVIKFKEGISRLLSSLL